MNTATSDAHRRRSIRLKHYDYSQAGAYFVTICTHARACVFGDVVDGAMVLNDAGKMAAQCWRAIPEHFPRVALDVFVVMPNHVHGILFIHDAPENVGAKTFGFGEANNHSLLPHGTSKTVGAIVRGFKIGVTKWVRRHTAVCNVWQRNYYEHIIRDEASLLHLREYINNNPLQWELDCENPKNCGGE